MQLTNTIKGIATISLIGLATFVALELTLRVYLLGPMGLSPAKVDSFVSVFRAGILQPADNLEVWYELKPDIRQLYRGVEFRTSSHGLADQEYSIAKPANTMRIAVIGSSWTMGTGVVESETFQAILEDQLNSGDPGIRYEFINFGVENYGLGEMMGTLRHKALKYQPDMILFILTGHTPNVRWTPHSKPFEPLTASEGAESFVMLRIRGLLGLRRAEDREADAMRDLLSPSDWGLYFKQIERALGELASIGDKQEIAVATAWLRINGTPAYKKYFLRIADQAKVPAIVVDLDKYLDTGEPIHRLLVSRAEKHPNAWAHTLIADELSKAFFADRTSPAPNTGTR